MGEGHDQQPRPLVVVAGQVVQRAHALVADLVVDSSWLVTSATPAFVTESMLWNHQSMRSSGCSQLGVHPKSAG